MRELCEKHAFLEERSGEVVWHAWDRRAYGRREYYLELLRNVPEDRDVVDVCMSMPVENQRS